MIRAKTPSDESLVNYSPLVYNVLAEEALGAF